MNMREIIRLVESSGSVIPATPENIEKAKAFVLRKWIERHHEQYAGTSEENNAPKDLSYSCKFSSLFAQRIFGGQVRGNYDHQFVVLDDGRVLDLNIDAEDVRALDDPHEHDEDFWDNDDHRYSLDTCRPRVNAWVKEFLASNNLSESRLDELQGVKRHLEQGLASKQAVIAYMQKKGFELLGAGTFGAVFDHPSFAGKYVIKVFSDPNYEYFVDFCRTQPQNPNLPKFFGKTIPLGPHGRMVRMERLYVPANPLDRDVAAVLTLASRAAFDDIDESEAESLVAGYPEPFQGLYKTAFELCMISPGGSATIDMIGNVMVRKSGDTLVISDPYDGSDFKM